MAGDSYRRIKSQKQGYAMLKCIANARKLLSTAEIAEQMAESADTVICWLKTAEDEGFVRQIGDRWETGFALALMHAKVRSSLEASRDRIDRDLDRLTIAGEV